MARLLAHYWTAADSETARQDQVEDWLDDLRDYPVLVVKAACERWRRQPGERRPVPGSIRSLCIEEMRDYRSPAQPAQGPEISKERRALLDADARAASDAMAREGREISTRWARARGHDDLTSYAAAKGVSYEAACIEVCSSLLAGSPLAAALPAIRPGREWTPAEMRQGRIGLGLEMP